jgi:predicted Zn-dependent protease
MFETIEKEGGGSAPQWLSSHPNPGNRSRYIAEEAAQLTVGRRPDDRGFAEARARFASLPPARSMAEIERARKRPTR